jgi:hypothetical protein
VQNVLWLDASANKLLGPMTFLGQWADYAYYYDYFNTAPQTYTLSTDPALPTAVRVERTGHAPAVLDGVIQVLLYAAGGGNSTVNMRSSPNTFLVAVVGDNSSINIGSAAPNGGTVDGLLGSVLAAAYSDEADINVVIDDSGNTKARQVKVVPRTGPYDHGNHIEGVLPGTIFFRENPGIKVDLRTGQADDTFTVTGGELGSALRIDGGAGSNTLDYAESTNLPGLVSWYKGQGNAADVIGGLPGSFRNGATTAPGLVGHAFSLDGVDDFVEIADSSDHTPTSITLEAWVKPDTVSGARVIMSKYQSHEPDNKSWALLNIDGRIRFGVYQGTAARAIDTDAPVLTEGVWQHVAATFDVATGDIKIYLNGALVPSSFVPGGHDATITAITDSTSPVRIGSIVNVHGTMVYYWDGLIDEVGLFGRALSAAEVQGLFAAGSAGKSAAAGVVVNLPLGQATWLRGGIANIQNVTGSAGNDILVGNGGNVLRGGAGRDLLIAGPSGGSLFGDEGEDLLIGGTTAYDADPAGLEAVRAEWTRRDADYDTRVANLTGGLSVDAGSLLGGSAVTSNGGPNSLFGEVGLDVFFALLSEVKDREEGEVVV